MIAHPTDVPTDAEVAVVVAGPTLSLLGHVLFRLRVTGWISWERLAGAVLCLLAGFVGTAAPGLALATLLVAVLVVVIPIEPVVAPGCPQGVRRGSASGANAARPSMLVAFRSAT